MTDKLRGLLASSAKYNLHTHTQFCDGHADMQDFAAEAHNRGFGLLGFSPHSPIPFDSSCNMKAADVPAYLAEVQCIKGLYPDMTILAGMEIDYISPDWGPASPFFNSLDLDYAIGSVHFIPAQDGTIIDVDGSPERFCQNMREHFHDDIEYVVSTFFSHTISMVEAGGFDIVGHYDKIRLNAGLYMPGVEDKPWFKALVDNATDAIIASGALVEVNTKAWEKHHCLYPAQHLWRRLLSAGVTLVVNSDAHYPMLIDANRQQALKAIEYIKKQIS